MCTISEPPAAIEGSKILIAGQDIRPVSIPRPLKNSDEIVYHLSVYKRGKSTTIEENSPKEWKISKWSLLDKGCSILGCLLWGFSSYPLDKNKFDIGAEGRTAAHPGESVEIEGTCFMTIVDGLQGKPLLVHPKEILLV